MSPVSYTAYCCKTLQLLAESQRMEEKLGEYHNRKSESLCISLCLDDTVVK